jgi:hypothetical protein
MKTTASQKRLLKEMRLKNRAAQAIKRKTGKSLLPAYSGQLGREIADIGCQDISHSLYDDVLKLERARVWDSNIDLEAIVREIRLRVKITQNEIFKIGELLSLAKTACQQQGEGFQEWIVDNFDFSYESANNFMNVYKHCFGFRHLALNVPLSILYQVSKPNFPEQLREYLFAQGNLDRITNGQLKKITQKFIEGGFDSIRNDVETMNDNVLIYRQTGFAMDLCNSAQRTLKTLSKKLDDHDSAFFPTIPVAQEIHDNLRKTILASIEALETAVNQSKQMMGEQWNKVMEECKM